MNGGSLKLRRLDPAAKLGLTFLVLVVIGGIVASLSHIRQHHANRDEQPGLSIVDIKGAYHGVRTIAPLVTALEREHPSELEFEESDPLTDADRAVLLAWLGGERISEDYDNLDLGDAAPAEILARSCLSCHSRQATEGDESAKDIRLDYWDDVKAIAFSREINPPGIDILTISTHTHALSLATLSIVLAGLLLATSWPRPLVNGCILLLGLGLAADLSAWWLARSMEGFIWMLIIGGGVYCAMTVLTSLAIIVDLWLPSKATD